MAKESELLLAKNSKRMKQNKEFKSTTLSGQIVVSKTESGWDMVQVLPDNPCRGKVESFRGRGKGHLHDDGTFIFLKKRRNRHATVLKLPHSSLSFGWDEQCRFIVTGPMDQLEEFIKWLSTESQQAIEFLKLMLETEQQMFGTKQAKKEAEV